MTVSDSRQNDLRTPFIPAQRRAPSDPARHRGAEPRTTPTSRHLRHLPRLALAIDLVALTVAEVLAALGRGVLPYSTTDAVEYVPRLLVAAPLIALGWVGVLAAMGAYNRAVFGLGTDEFRRVLSGSAVTAALIGVGCYLLRFELSRGFFNLAMVLGAAFLLVGRLALRLALSRLRRRGRLQQRVLVVGTPGHVDDIASVLTREKRLGYDVIGAAVPHTTTVDTTASGVPVLGASAALVGLAVDSEADVVFLAGGAVESAAEMRRTAVALERNGVRVVLAPSITDVSRERVKIRPVGGLPLLHVDKPRSAAALARAKRTFDVVGSGALILALSPVLLFAAYKVRRFDRGPILFRQQRIGVGGTPFGCFKFRTMVVDAEARLAEVLAAQGAEHGLFAKLKEDPRITRPGRWMRRYSVDELPQLFNVLNGDMSLIGPRPQVAHEVALYDDTTARRLRVRPGMTGLWQVSGRSDLSVAEAIRLDLYYVDNWSMLQDLTILARTVRAVFGSDGAY